MKNAVRGLGSSTAYGPRKEDQSFCDECERLWQGEAESNGRLTMGITSLHTLVVTPEQLPWLHRGSWELPYLDICVAIQIITEHSSKNVWPSFFSKSSPFWPLRSWQCQMLLLCPWELDRLERFWCLVWDLVPCCYCLILLECQKKPWVWAFMVCWNVKFLGKKLSLF